MDFMAFQHRQQTGPPLPILSEPRPQIHYITIGWLSWRASRADACNDKVVHEAVLLYSVPGRGFVRLGDTVSRGGPAVWGEGHDHTSRRGEDLT